MFARQRATAASCQLRGEPRSSSSPELAAHASFSSTRRMDRATNKMAPLRLPAHERPPQGTKPVRALEDDAFVAEASRALSRPT